VSYKVRLDNFEGPFDLLIYLIEKAEIDIYDIPIARITEEYLEHLSGWEYIDLDAASEFLLLASRLIEIKAKILLPAPIEDISREDIADPREELVERLVEYRLFRRLAATLGEIAQREGNIFTKDTAKSADWLPRERPLRGVSLSDLTAAFWKVLAEIPAPSPPLALREKKLNVDDKVEELSNILAAGDSSFLFRELFPTVCTRLEIIVTFLALLELIHRGFVTASQEENFGDIFIHWCGRL